jgi:hypothetical protein
LLKFAFSSVCNSAFSEFAISASMLAGVAAAVGDGGEAAGATGTGRAVCPDGVEGSGAGVGAMRSAVFGAGVLGIGGGAGTMSGVRGLSKK